MKLQRLAKEQRILGYVLLRERFYLHSTGSRSAQWRGYVFGALGKSLQWSPLAENYNNYHIY
jgi:hypothetical protein